MLNTTFTEAGTLTRPRSCFWLAIKRAAFGKGHATHEKLSRCSALILTESTDFTRWSYIKYDVTAPILEGARSRKWKRLYDAITMQKKKKKKHKTKLTRTYCIVQNVLTMDVYRNDHIRSFQNQYSYTCLLPSIKYFSTYKFCQHNIQYFIVGYFFFLQTELVIKCLWETCFLILCAVRFNLSKTHAGAKFELADSPPCNLNIITSLLTRSN